MFETARGMGWQCSGFYSQYNGLIELANMGILDANASEVEERYRQLEDQR